MQKFRWFKQVAGCKLQVTSFKFSGWVLILWIAGVLGCGKGIPTLEGIDQAVWKNDRNACKRERTLMADAITRQRSKLLSLTEIDIVRLLGNPDRNELFKRNQKFYYYFLEPAPECKLDSVGSKSRKLIVRFNAMGLAKEVEVK
jgi:hypothetical protein